MHISNNMVSHIIDIANFLTQLFFCDFQPLPHIFAPPLFSLWCVTKLPVPWFVIWLLFIIIKTLKSEILHYWGRIFETLGQATPSHPTPLPPKKTPNFIWYSDSQETFTNYHGRNSKISKIHFSQLKNGGRGSIQPPPRAW